MLYNVNIENKKLKCCICGFEQDKSILSHVRNVHKMSSQEYKRKFNMPLRNAWLKGNNEYFKNILGKINSKKMTNQPGRATLCNKWSRKFNKCISCNSSKRKHVSNGLCQRCYSRKKMKQRTLLSNLKIMDDGVDGIDYVICKICGNPYRTLTDHGHLVEHKITSKEYRAKFPDAKLYCLKSTRKQADGISIGRKKLMVKRGYLNPQSQRDSKRVEMIRKHTNKEFATISKIEDVVSEWFEKNNYNVYWTEDNKQIDENSIVRQFAFLDKYCVDFACPQKK